MTTHHAVVTRGNGGAIVSAERSPDGKQEITAIERFPFEVGPIVTRALQLKDDDPTCSVVVDAEGLGDAVWELLGRPRRSNGWHLYAKHGLDREELTRVLLVAVERQNFSFTPGLTEEQAMKKALIGLSRNVREDGPGSELAVALSLALEDHRPPKPRIC